MKKFGNHSRKKHDYAILLPKKKELQQLRNSYNLR